MEKNSDTVEIKRADENRLNAYLERAADPIGRAIVDEFSAVRYGWGEEESEFFSGINSREELADEFAMKGEKR